MIIEQGLKVPDTSGSIGLGQGNRVNDDYRRSRVRWLDRVTEQWSPLAAKMEHAFRRSNHAAFGFDLGYFHEIQFTEYDAKYEGKYDWHEDIFWVSNKSTCSHRKLSMVVQLTDPAQYTGGDLELKEQPPEKSKLRSQGTVIVFPSFLEHRVTPVTVGKRYSLVSWYEGPPFR